MIAVDRVQIGELGGEGSDNFEIEVCSPQWLERPVDRDKVVSGRNRLFMDGFNFDALESYVLKRVRQAEGSNWESVAEKLSRWALWEFEDYRP